MNKKKTIHISPGTNISTPEKIASGSSMDPPARIWPQSGKLFAERSLRLKHLANDHAMADYLQLMAAISQAQHLLQSEYPQIALPSADELAAARAQGHTPLAASAWPRDPVWRQPWRLLLAQLLQSLPATSPARAVIEKAQNLDDQSLQDQVNRLLSGRTLGLDLGLAPLLAAGLQLYWTVLVERTLATHPQAFALSPDETRCPACSSLPAASITRVGGGMHGQRYLHCSLCNTEWHMRQVKCTHCLKEEHIRYKGLQSAHENKTPSARPTAEAETCEDCKHYLKIIHMERDARVDPLADDLASLTLDLLVSQAGYIRHGSNFMLIFGEDSASDMPIIPDLDIDSSSNLQ